jgi:hypothetical protein
MMTALEFVALMSSAGVADRKHDVKTGMGKTRQKMALFHQMCVASYLLKMAPFATFISTDSNAPGLTCAWATGSSSSLAKRTGCWEPHIFD